MSDGALTFGIKQRPVYETKSDQQREDRISTMLSDVWNVQVEKLKKFSSADIALVSHGKIRAFAEIKVRSNPRLRYPTYMISLHKLEDLARLHAFSGKPCILVVQWSDGLRWWTVPKSVEHLDIEMGGTYRRGDPQDREPVVMIPIEEFVAVAPRKLNRRTPQ
jgi:hypothetical protein